MCFLWLSALHNIHITAAYLEGLCNSIGDAIFHLYEHNHLLSFYSILNGHLGRIAVDNLALTDHMSSYSCSLVFYRCMQPTVGFSVATGSF